jgi:hypothetical protein
VFHRVDDVFRVPELEDPLGVEVPVLQQVLPRFFRDRVTDLEPVPRLEVGFT